MKEERTGHMSSAVTAWAAYSSNEDIRLRSSSGGMFFEFARYIISLDGIVYGVAMSNDNKSAEYIFVNNIDELHRLFGSKYIQPHIGDTFCNVKRNLDDGKIVLFSGTGCIINGLKSFLVKEYRNLLCIDLICHGVPSPLLWRKYVDNIETSEKEKVSYISFRCKNVGWEEYGILRKGENKTEKYISKEDDAYMCFFLRNLSLRPSCYECHAKKTRLADITLGDFWGIDQVEPSMNDNKGISIVIIRTEKGEKYFDIIKNRAYVKKVDYEKAIKHNSAEYMSVNRPITREEFFRDIIKCDITGLQRKYLRLSFGNRIKKWIKSKLITKRMEY